MAALKECSGLAFSLVLCGILLTCTTLDFNSSEDDTIPQIEVESSVDTVTMGDDYTLVFDVSDDKDNPEDLKKNVIIWVENEDGESVDNDTFTEEAGVYFIFLKVTDSDGNKSDIVKITVIVSDEDETPPVITLLGPVPYVLNVNDKYNEPGAVAVDNFDGDISDDIKICGDVNTSSENECKITYTVKDKAGNKAEVKRTVRVKENNGDDKEKPEIKLKGDNPMHLQVGESFKDPGATATDNEDGDITDKIKKFSNAVNTARPGTYKVYYVVEDEAGNIAIAKRTVIVENFVDTEPPVITLRGDNPMYLELDEEYKEPGATAEDNKDGDLTDEIVIDNSEVNTSENGIYSVYYKVSDAAGNEAEETRTVTVGVIDSVPPEIILLGDNPMIVDYKSVYKEPGAYAIDSVGDEVDSIPFSQFTVENDINVTELGNYKVIYTVSDASGNESSEKRTVEVADISAPVITINGPNPINLTVGYPYTEHGATAVDNYDGDVTDELDILGEVNTSVPGTYEITYKVTDSHGNKAEEIRIVNVSNSTTNIDTFSLTMRTLDKRYDSGTSGGKVGAGERGSTSYDSFETLFYNSLYSLNNKTIIKVTVRIDISHVDSYSSGKTATLYEQNKGNYSSSAKYTTYSNSSWSSSLGTVRATSNGWNEITGTTLKNLIQAWASGQKKNNGLIMGGDFGQSNAYWNIDESMLIVKWED